MSPHTKSTEDASHHRSMVEHGGDQNLNAFGRQYLSQRLEIQERIINPTERIDVIQSSEGSSRLNVLETFDDQMNKNSLPSELAKSVTIQLQEERLLKEETAQTKIHYSDPTSVQDDHLASKGSTLNAADHSTTKVNSLSSEDPRDTPKSMVNVAIQSYVGTEQWGREVRQKIVWMFGIGQQSATLTLNPPNLGPLHVTLKMQNNIAHTTFRSNDPAVRQALAEGMVQLNEMMSQRGLILGKMSIHEINQEILKDEV
jgi:flagellar hook-length control protein FliK